MKNKKGNSLIEVLAAVSILIVAVIFIGIPIERFYKMEELNLEVRKSENILEIIEKELKYEIKICDLKNILEEKKVIYFKTTNDFEEQILNNNILSLSNEQEGNIKIEKESYTETSVKVKISCEELKYEKIFEKEKWMEMQGIYTN